MLPVGKVVLHFILLWRDLLFLQGTICVFDTLSTVNDDRSWRVPIEATEPWADPVDSFEADFHFCLF